MKVRMTANITGCRNGVNWPAPGEEIDLPDNEAAEMCAAGYAEPIAEPAKAEKRPAPKKSTETRKD